MSKMVAPPMLVTGWLCWDIHCEGPETSFYVQAAAWKRALGLRPRSRDDENAAERIAKRNWALLELVAREAFNSGFVRTDNSKGWMIRHDIHESVFLELLSKHADQIVR